MIASHVGEDTPQSSIVLACEQPMTGYHETNFSMAYSSHISWQSPDSPVPVEVYPSLAWDNLFDNRGSLLNISILDRVKDRAQDLSRKISATDKGKLDEYLTSVREVEKRVEGMRKGKADAEDAAKAKNTVAATMDRPANGLPEDLRDHARLMCDIIAIAFQTNKTRVASLIISRDLSAMYYPFLDVKEGHHAASHNNNSDGYERIARFHVSQYAYLASKLDSMKEGDGTVLDNTCLMFLSNLWIGRKHDNFRLPLVLAGGLGGTLETGRYAQLSERKRGQPQDVQPVPVADGPLRSKARPVWRLPDTPGTLVVRARKLTVPKLLARVLGSLLSAAILTPQSRTSWADYGGSADSSQYSDLAQVNRDNVGKLHVVWRYSTGDPGKYLFNPIVVHGVMYVLAKRNSIVALDAKTGKELWVHETDPNTTLITNRGINYWESSDGTRTASAFLVQ